MGVYRQMKAKLNKLDYDFSQFDLMDFAQWLEEKRKRKIIFIPYPMPGMLFGLWVTDMEKPLDYIVYDNCIPTIHRNHIILHELSHIICEHKPYKITEKQLTTSKFGVFDRLAFYSSKEEQEAEMLAILIQEKVFQSRNIKLSSISETGFYLSQWMQKPIYSSLQLLGLS